MSIHISSGFIGILLCVCVLSVHSVSFHVYVGKLCAISHFFSCAHYFFAWIVPNKFSQWQARRGKKISRGKYVWNHFMPLFKNWMWLKIFNYIFPYCSLNPSFSLWVKAEKEWCAVPHTCLHLWMDKFDFPSTLHYFAENAFHFHCNRIRSVHILLVQTTDIHYWRGKLSRGKKRAKKSHSAHLDS